MWTVTEVHVRALVHGIHFLHTLKCMLNAHLSAFVQVCCTHSPRTQQAAADSSTASSQGVPTLVWLWPLPVRFGGKYINGCFPSPCSLCWQKYTLVNYGVIPLYFSREKQHIGLLFLGILKVGYKGNLDENLSFQTESLLLCVVSHHRTAQEAAKLYPLLTGGGDRPGCVVFAALICFLSSVLCW